MIQQQNLDRYKDNEAEFEKENCKVGKNYAKYCGDHYEIFNRTNMKDYYEHVQVIGQDSFINAWFIDPLIKRYDDFGVYPNSALCPKNVFNLWTPFICELKTDEFTYDQSAVDLFLYHIRENLCNGEEELSDFTLMWIAHLIQYPENKSVMLALVGPQGQGKGWLVDLLKKMLGDKKVFQTSQPDLHVWGNFNPEMKDAFLVNVNELDRKQFKDSMGKIKELITDPTIAIRPLYCNVFSVTSYHRFLATSNDLEAMPVKEGDRRFVIVEGKDDVGIRDEDSDEVKNEKATFFKKLTKFPRTCRVRNIYKY